MEKIMLLNFFTISLPCCLSFKSHCASDKLNRHPSPNTNRKIWVFIFKPKNIQKKERKINYSTYYSLK